MTRTRKFGIMLAVKNAERDAPTSPGPRSEKEAQLIAEYYQTIAFVGG